MTKAELRKTATRILSDPSLEDYAHQCHGASLKLVQSGQFEECRVARGGCKGVGAQHSWLVLGDDCYDDEATIIDPTLWSYDEDVKGVWIGTYQDGRHTPHGKGSIWDWGRPDPASGPIMTLTPRKPWSGVAEIFLDMLGPLDEEGWKQLAHAPVEGWPAGEIIDAICESGLEGYVPIDIVGMVTDRKAELYLPGGGKE